MGKTIKILNNQSLFDIAVQYTGSIEKVFDIAIENNMAVTGSSNTVDYNGAILNKNIVEFYSKEISPATGSDLSEPEAIGTGSSALVNITYSPPSSDINVKEYQSLFDLAVQYLGGIEAAFDLCACNKISITDDLPKTIGNSLTIQDFAIKQYYDNNSLIPATGKIEEIPGQEVLEGIGYWAIEIDFVVS